MRPLLICDCDEVLLHMVRHFGDWVGEAHDMDFTVGHPEVFRTLRHRSTGERPAMEKAWELLGGFFPAEMGRQTLVPHAAEALAALGERADIVILTNIGDECRGPRRDQLLKFGIDARVECNGGGKGVSAFVARCTQTTRRARVCAEGRAGQRSSASRGGGSSAMAAPTSMAKSGPKLAGRDRRPWLSAGHWGAPHTGPSLPLATPRGVARPQPSPAQSNIDRGEPARADALAARTATTRSSCAKPTR